MISESKLESFADIPTIKGYAHFARLRDGKSGGVVVWVRKHLRVQILDMGQECPLYDDLWLEITAPEGKLILAALYIPPGSGERSDRVFLDLQEKVGQIKMTSLPLVMVGDLNAHVGIGRGGIPNNPVEEVAGHGENLRLMVEAMDMRMANADPICKYLATRWPRGEQHGRAGILDYVLLMGEDLLKCYVDR